MVRPHLWSTSRKSLQSESPKARTTWRFSQPCVVGSGSFLRDSRSICLKAFFLFSFQEHLKAFDDEVNAFLDNMFGPRGE